ncbi:ASP-6 protein [Aphelenchoides avenae]|nr:ASP-6 protein [Aphelenchus avenae]
MRYAVFIQLKFASALCKFICRSDCCGPNAWPPSEPTCGKKENLIDCGSGKKFNNETSTTYKLDGSWFCNEAFAIQAFTGIDTVQIGSPKGADLSIPSSMFGQVWQQDIDVEIPIDAVFGLASAATAPENYVPPLLNAFKAGLVSEPTVTLWLNKSSTPAVEDHLAPGFGILTIGGSDKTRCGPLGPFISMYQPEAQGVRVELKSISMGKTTTAPGRPGNNLPWVLRFGFVEDTTGWLPEPRTTLRGTGMGELAVAAGAKYDQAADAYRIACDARQPALQMNFSGASIAIPFSDFIAEASSGCVLNFAEDDCDRHSCPFVAYLTGAYCLTIDIAKNSLAFSANIAT